MMKLTALTVLLLAFTGTSFVAQEWTKESKDRAKRAALHGSSQFVRGDSGKWNDDAQLQHAPPIEQKPAKMSLDAWADLLKKRKVQVTDQDDNWLIFRTEQLDDNDRIWVERIERRGRQITVVAHLAKWQGKYFRNFTAYEVIGVNIGKLPAGDYEAKWITRPFVFNKFDGDGKALNTNWPLDERAAAKKSSELRVSFSVK